VLFAPHFPGSLLVSPHCLAPTQRSLTTAVSTKKRFRKPPRLPPTTLFTCHHPFDVLQNALLCVFHPSRLAVCFVFFWQVLWPPPPLFFPGLPKPCFTQTPPSFGDCLPDHHRLARALSPSPQQFGFLPLLFLTEKTSPLLNLTLPPFRFSLKTASPLTPQLLTLAPPPGILFQTLCAFSPCSSFCPHHPMGCFFFSTGFFHTVPRFSFPPGPASILGTISKQRPPVVSPISLFYPLNIHVGPRPRAAAKYFGLVIKCLPKLLLPFAGGGLLVFSAPPFRCFFPTHFGSKTNVLKQNPR